MALKTYWIIKCKHSSFCFLQLVPVGRPQGFEHQRTGRDAETVSDATVVPAAVPFLWQILTVSWCSAVDCRLCHSHCFVLTGTHGELMLYCWLQTLWFPLCFVLIQRSWLKFCSDRHSWWVDALLLTADFVIPTVFCPDTAFVVDLAFIEHHIDTTVSWCSAVDCVDCRLCHSHCVLFWYGIHGWLSFQRASRRYNSELMLCHWLQTLWFLWPVVLIQHSWLAWRS